MGATNNTPPAAVEVGDVVKPNYNSGPYLVLQVFRGCTCPSFDETIDKPTGKQRKRQPHMHLVCGVAPESPDHYSGRYYLSGYDEETLCRVADSDGIVRGPHGEIGGEPDQLIIVRKGCVQLGLKLY